jgi:hypothetical protein
MVGFTSSRTGIVLCGRRGNKPGAVDVWAMLAAGCGRGVGRIWSCCGGMEGRKRAGADRRTPPRPTTAARHHARDPRAPHHLSDWFPAKSGRKPRPSPPSTDTRGGTLGMQERGRERCRGWGRGFAGRAAGEGRVLAGLDAREAGRGRGAGRAAPAFSMQGTGSFFCALGGRGNLGDVHLPERRLPR